MRFPADNDRKAGGETVRWSHSAGFETRPAFFGPGKYSLFGRFDLEELQSRVGQPGGVSSKNGGPISLGRVQLSNACLHALQATDHVQIIAACEQLICPAKDRASRSAAGSKMTVSK